MPFYNYYNFICNLTGYSKRFFSSSCTVPIGEAGRGRSLDRFRLHVCSSAAAPARLARADSEKGPSIRPPESELTTLRERAVRPIGV